MCLLFLEDAFENIVPSRNKWAVPAEVELFLHCKFGYITLVELL